MSKANIDRVEQLVLPVLDKNLLELVDVEYVKEGSNWFLRIYIDRVGGISLDDCQAASEEIEVLLDEADILKSAYILEVSSPGERPLKKERDFERYKGQLVELKLYEPIDGAKIFEGNLEGLIDGKIIILYSKKKFEFDKEKVALVKRVFKL